MNDAEDFMNVSLCPKANSFQCGAAGLQTEQRIAGLAASRTNALTSPFSSGTIREYSVVQMTSSSPLILSMVFCPNRSIQSLLEAAWTNNRAAE